MCIKLHTDTHTHMLRLSLFIWKITFTCLPSRVIMKMKCENGSEIMLGKLKIALIAEGWFSCFLDSKTIRTYQCGHWPGAKYSSFSKHWLKEGHGDQQHGGGHWGLVVQQLHRVHLQFMLFGSYPLKIGRQNTWGRKKIPPLSKQKMRL